MPNLPQELLSELNYHIENHHLESASDAILQNSSECHAMVATGPDDYTTLGNTRFGGVPDLPTNVPWPSGSDPDRPSYSNFVAQINFSELPRLEEDVLPSSGILYLFVRHLDSAAAPVILDAIFHDGGSSTLRRHPCPSQESLCDEYLVDLAPHRIESIPSVSIASFRRKFRQQIESSTVEIDGDDGGMRLIELESDLHRDAQIGQILGYANTCDEQEDLYRQVVLTKLGKRELVYNDYWDSIEEYEAYIEERSDDKKIAKEYEEMRGGVVWLQVNREMIKGLVDEWRLLFRLDSNHQMNMNINDADPLYVFIRNEDLASRDFSNLVGEVTQG